jgi:hypothetical protein
MSISTRLRETRTDHEETEVQRRGFTLRARVEGPPSVARQSVHINLARGAVPPDLLTCNRWFVDVGRRPDYGSGDTDL